MNKQTSSECYCFTSFSNAFSEPFCWESCSHCSYLINRHPSKSLGNKSLLGTTLVHHPHCLSLNSPIPKVFNYTAFVHIRKYKRSNLILVPLSSFSWDTKRLSPTRNSMFLWMSHFMNLYNTIHLLLIVWGRVNMTIYPIRQCRFLALTKSAILTK